MKELLRALLKVVEARATGWMAAGATLLLLVLGEASLPAAVEQIRNIF